MQEKFEYSVFITSVLINLLCVALTKPILVSPTGKVREVDVQFWRVTIFYVNYLFFFVVFVLVAEMEKAIHYKVLFLLATITGTLMWLIVALPRIFGSNEYRIRALGCNQCHKPLKRLTKHRQVDLQSSLSRKERVAVEIGGIKIEQWYCHYCYPEPDANSVHLRIHANNAAITWHGLTAPKFKECPTCKEMTMIGNLDIKYGDSCGTADEAYALYACTCCSKKETKYIGCSGGYL